MWLHPCWSKMELLGISSFPSQYLFPANKCHMQICHIALARPWHSFHLRFWSQIWMWHWKSTLCTTWRPPAHLGSYCFTNKMQLPSYNQEAMTGSDHFPVFTMDRQDRDWKKGSTNRAWISLLQNLCTRFPLTVEVSYSSGIWKTKERQPLLCWTKQLPSRGHWISHTHSK